MINGNFKVDNIDFANWFNTVFQLKNSSLFKNKIIVDNVNTVLNHIYEITGKDTITLNEFVGVFCIIYNETGGRFISIAEQGTEDYFNRLGYGLKGRGRGLVQLTHDYQYKHFFRNYSWVHNYDSLTSEQLDALFLDPAIYYLSAKAYFTDAGFAGNYWYLFNAGKFGDFGATIGCGNPKHPCPQYRPLYENRCQTLLKSLQNQKIGTDKTYKGYFSRNIVRVIKNPIYIGVASGLLLIFTIVSLSNSTKKIKNNKPSDKKGTKVKI